MTQTVPLIEYDPTILVRAPREQATQLARSAAADGHRRHSVLSLAVQLGVWPVLVHDVLRVMQEQIRAQDYQVAHDEHRASAAALTAIDEACERAVWGADRYQGSYEIPVDHDEFDGTSWAGDRYLTDDAITWVLDSIHPAIVTGEAAARGVHR